MAEYTIAGFSGIHPSSNPLSGRPRGALTSAVNVCIRNGGSIEPRRGFVAVEYWPAAEEGTNLGSPNSLHLYGDTIFAATLGGTLYRDTGSAFTAVVGRSVSPGVATSVFAGSRPPAKCIRGVESKGSFYWNSSTGVRVLDEEGGEALDAGVPRALGSYSMAANTSGAQYDATVGRYLAGGHSAAYVFVWGYKDANGRILLGAPSGREVFVNPSDTVACNVDLRVIIPPGITTDHFLRIYRTPSVPAGEVPGEEYYLVYELTGLTTTDLNTNRYTPNILELYPDSILADPLYTNFNQGDGTLAANDRPPLCSDMCWFDGRMLFANTQQPHTLLLTLLGVDPTAAGSGAIQSGDTITIDGVTFTASTVAEDLATKTFKIANTGSPTRDIAETARSLVRCVNYNYQAWASDLYIVAYYLSADTGTQGTIALQRASFTSFSFSVTVSGRGASWSPALPTAFESGSAKPAIRSDAEAIANRIYYSKIGQPEAVPALNWVDVGAENKQILRVWPLRDRLLIFKEDGLYTASFVNSRLVAREFDPSVVLRASESLGEAGNRVFGVTEKGVVEVSSAGVKPVSDPVKFAVQSADSSARGIGYPTDNYYILAPIVVGAPLLIYHLDYGLWTEWEFPRSEEIGSRYGRVISLLVSPTTAGGNLYIGYYMSEPGGAYPLHKEVKGVGTFSLHDGSDTVGVSAASAAQITLTSATTDVFGWTPEEGWYVSMSNDDYGRIASFDPVTKVAILDHVVGSFADAVTSGVTVYRPYDCHLDFSPIDVGAPGLLKDFSGVTFHFGPRRFVSANAEFTTDFRSEAQSVSVRGNDATLTTQTGTGDTYALLDRSASNKRVLVPIGCKRAGYLKPSLTIRQNRGMFWALHGLTVEYEPTSERVSI